jgi:hypothetical protein
MAISTQAKAFLASPVSQKVVHDIYYGRIVFTMAGRRSILADNYKPRAIELYDYRSAPFIDHYRSVVTFASKQFPENLPQAEGTVLRRHPRISEFYDAALDFRAMSVS